MSGISPELSGWIQQQIDRPEPVKVSETVVR
jgi:hypothetical protein